MKNCGNIRELILCLENKMPAVLQVADISHAFSTENEVYLFINKDMYFSVKTEQWKFIRDHIINKKGVYFKDIPKHQRFYR